MLTGPRISAVMALVGVLYAGVMPGVDAQNQSISVIGGSALGATKTKTANENSLVLTVAAYAQDRAPEPAKPIPQSTAQPGRVIPPSFSVIEVAPDGHIRFKGHGTPGSRVTLNREGRALGSAVVASDGMWTLSLNKQVTDGEHVFSSAATSTQGSTPVLGSDVRISIPQGFGTATGDARQAITITQRTRAEDLARAASERFTQIQAERGDGESLAFKKIASKETNHNGAKTGLDDRESHGGVIFWLQEWLASSNRDFQKKIVRPLQVPDVKSGSISNMGDAGEQPREADKSVAPKMTPKPAPKPESEQPSKRAQTTRGENVAKLREERNAREQALLEAEISERRRRTKEDGAQLEKQRVAAAKAEEAAHITLEEQRQRQAIQEAEAARRAAAARQEEDARKANEARIAAEAARRAAQEEAKRKAEAERLAAAERAAARRAEAERLAAQQRAELEQRRQTEAEAARQRAEQQAAVAAAERVAEMKRLAAIEKARREKQAREAEAAAAAAAQMELKRQRQAAADAKARAEAEAREKAKREAAEERRLNEERARLAREAEIAKAREQRMAALQDEASRQRTSTRPPSGGPQETAGVTINEAENERANLGEGHVMPAAWRRFALLGDERTGGTATLVQGRDPLSEDGEGDRVAANAPRVPLRIDPSSCRQSGRRVDTPGNYVVKRGDSLWRISQRHYRHGRFWPEIFRANEGKISDPDLIFPCQRFHLPKVGGG